MNWDRTLKPYLIMLCYIGLAVFAFAPLVIAQELGWNLSAGIIFGAAFAFLLLYGGLILAGLAIWRRREDIRKYFQSGPTLPDDPELRRAWGKTAMLPTGHDETRVCRPRRRIRGTKRLG